MNFVPFRTFGALLGVTTCCLAASAAEVFQVTAETRAALPGGKEADGMIGDWLLRNDRVVAVIGKTADWRDANQMVEGVQGAVLDFTSLADNNDQLVVLYPMGYRPTGVSANRAEVRQAKGNVAELAVIRDPSPEEPYRTTTIYRLRDGEAFLHLRTIHENPSDAAVTVIVRDWLRLDNDLVCPQEPGEHPVIAMDNPWFDAAYGLVASDGRAQATVRDLSRRNLRDLGSLVHYPALTPDAKAEYSLAPGERLEVSRYLVVARDVAGVQLAAADALQRPASAVVLHVTETDGSPAPGVRCHVTRAGKFYSSAITNARGAVRLPLADGNYEVACEQIGREALTFPLEISGGKPVGETKRALPARSFLALDVAETGSGARLPVKIELRGRGDTPNPFLGPQKRAHGAASLFYSARGTDTFPVPPGDYAVHVSRGPEFELEVVPVKVTAGETTRATARLRRAFTTPGWITADFHNHSTGSGDSAVEQQARVLNLAGAGIEFAPATEHNRISTYTPTIAALGIERYIASAPSIELSGRPGPGDINHQIAFPLQIRPELQGYGAPRTDVDPGVQMRRLFELDDRSPKLMQQNHPNIGWLYFDRDRDGVADGGFGTREITDVMEIREAMHTLLADTAPDNREEHRGRAFYWLQMLNQGDRIYGTANTDSHNVSPVSGSVFNYVRVDDTDISRLDPWDVARAAKRGHLVMSKGPFLDVAIGDAIPGDDVTATDGKVNVKIKVYQAGWSRIDRVQVLVNGRQLPEANFTRAHSPEAFRDDALQSERIVSLTLERDAHLIVVATGENETMAKLSSGPFGKLRPIAVANPIFVDVDGGGFTANRDTLGLPLPDGKPRKGERGKDND